MSAFRPTTWRALLAVLVAAVLLAAASPADASRGDRGNRGDQSRNPSHVVTANRGSGDVSVINIDTLDVVTHDLPGDAEPMYVNHDRRNGLVWVGDRATSTVVALDDDTYAVAGTVAVGDGVFHQWLDARRSRLWVVGDTSDTVSVVDTKNQALVDTFSIPADLIADGASPHDVFVSGRHAFVSMVGLSSGDGVVVRYSARTFEETGRIDTGGDPHLFVDGGRLYVASQDAGTVTLYKTSNLAELAQIAVPDAHGIWVSRRTVLATNIGGGGTDAVWSLNRNLSTVLETTDTASPVPHNLTRDIRGQVWVTHSGPTSGVVTVFALGGNGFGTGQQVSVGVNPFGLAFVR